MITAGVRDLKNRTSELLRKARSEGSVIVTNHGKPVAAVIPLDPEDVEDFLLAHNPKIQAAVRRGTEDAKAGKVYSVEELIEEEERLKDG